MGVLRFSTIDKGEVYVDGTGKGTVTLRLFVMCSSPDDSLSVLRRDLAQYQKWQPHPSEPKFYVDQFRAIQRPHTANWEAQVDYIDTIEKNPLEIPARIGEVKSFTIPGGTLVDYQGNPIINTAGEPPEPFYKPEQIIAFPIIKNIPDLGDWLFDFESVLNQDSIRLGSKNCDPLTVMIRQITVSDTQEQGDIQYRTATMELWRRKSKWVEKWPSRGFNEVVSDASPFVSKKTGKPSAVAKSRRPILVNGERATEPQFLDQKGRWIAEPTLDQICMITTQIYPAINFSGYFPLK